MVTMSKRLRLGEGGLSPLHTLTPPNTNLTPNTYQIPNTHSNQTHTFFIYSKSKTIWFICTVGMSSLISIIILSPGRDTICPPWVVIKVKLLFLLWFMNLTNLLILLVLVVSIIYIEFQLISLLLMIFSLKLLYHVKVIIL